MQLDKSKITDVECSIDTSEYPVFCDSYISSAKYKGREMTEQQLEAINEDSTFVYDQIIESIF